MTTAAAPGLPPPSKPANCKNTGNFERWLDAFRKEARASGVSNATIASALGGMTLDPGIISRDRKQGFFAQTFTAFSGKLISKNRLDNGASRLKRHHDLLAKADKDHGVPGSVIVAFWAFVYTYIWAGPHPLHYHAVPEWVQSLGMVMSLILLAPSWAIYPMVVLAVAAAAIAAQAVISGAYSLTMRATGYDLKAPGAVTLTAGKTTTQDLALVRTADLTKQLSSREWTLSMPGSDALKRQFIQNGLSCTYCHSVERILKGKHTAEQLIPVMTRMTRYFEDGSAVPSGTGRAKATLKEKDRLKGLEQQQAWFGRVSKTDMATLIANANLSGGRTSFPYELKVLPRPKGTATKAIVTTWEIPRKDAVAHDAVVDSKGRVWYNEELTSRNMIVPGLVAVIMMIVAAMLTSRTTTPARRRRPAART